MTDEHAEVRGLQDLLDRLADASRAHEHVSVAHMVAAAGRRSFGPLLLLPGLIVLSPLSGIPGLPTTMAVIVLLVAGQLILRRRHVWLPGWVLRREASALRVEQAVRFLRPLARVTDRLVRARLPMLTEGPAVPLVALVCLLIAITMPPLELIPFANTIAGAALTALGLALTVHDGVLALLATVLSAGAIVFAIFRFLLLV